MTDGPRSCSLPRTSAVVLDRLRPHLADGARVLDAGAGEGYLTDLLVRDLRRRGVDAAVAACDLHPEHYRLDRPPCDRADLDDRLPYDDGVFDAVASVEVLEHLENPYRFLREARRVLRPGGRFVLTTPNVLTINSRLRTLSYGFAALFEVLPLAERDPRHLAGHIAPTPLYYACYMAERCGFEVVDVGIDRTKRSAAALAVVALPLLRLLEVPYRARLRRKLPAAYEENRRYLAWTNSWRVLTGRTLVMELRRPGRG